MAGMDIGIGPSRTGAEGDDPPPYSVNTLGIDESCGCSTFETLSKIDGVSSGNDMQFEGQWQVDRILSFLHVQKQQPR